MKNIEIKKRQCSTEEAMDDVRTGNIAPWLCKIRDGHKASVKETMTRSYIGKMFMPP